MKKLVLEVDPDRFIRGVVAREVTREVLDEFFAWTRNAPMFTSSPQGQVFAEELREAFSLAWETLEARDAAR